MEILRTEYPRPQFYRGDWKNLNGEWDFEIDNSVSGKDRKFYERTSFSGKINVPFCPESKLSGIGNIDFMAAVWYCKKIVISKKELEKNIILHFGAVDYLSEIYVNSKLAGSHSGGYSSFSFDITNFVSEGENTIVVYAYDDVRSWKQPRGKQCVNYFSGGCDYTRTTGIWQTVWLEFTPKTYIKDIKINTDYLSGNVSIKAQVIGDAKNVYLKTLSSFKGKEVNSSTVILSGKYTTINFTVANPKLWDCSNPNLYDLDLELVKDNKVIDNVTSYYGIRTIELVGKDLLINGKIVFQRLVLDQGFYPDGIYTAPSDEALKNDIVLSMNLGFNGARLHQKIFEARFLYWADKLGYIVWGEHANWGLSLHSGKSSYQFLPEWMEAIDRDYNHPSIVGWCPLNETWDSDGKRQDNKIVELIYKTTKSMDTTRPVIDTSGNYHVLTDIYDVHDYEQDVEVYKERYGNVTDSEVYDNHSYRQSYGGEAYFISEYGGILWKKDTDTSGAWGYGNAPKSIEEFVTRYEGLTTVLLECKNMCAFCYTQLYDVEQEQNGLYTYSREKKFSDEIYDRIKKANQQLSYNEKKK